MVKSHDTKTKEPAAKIGQILHYHRAEGDDVPMIVVRVDDDGAVSGQAFLDGTQTMHIEAATFGDEIGQCAIPA